MDLNVLTLLNTFFEIKISKLSVRLQMCQIPTCKTFELFHKWKTTNTKLGTHDNTGAEYSFVVSWDAFQKNKLKHTLVISWLVLTVTLEQYVRNLGLLPMTINKKKRKAIHSLRTGHQWEKVARLITGFLRKACAAVSDHVSQVTISNFHSWLSVSGCCGSRWCKHNKVTYTSHIFMADCQAKYLLATCAIH